MELIAQASRLRDLIAAFLPDYVRLVEPDLVPHLDLSDFVPRLPPEIPAACRPRLVVAEVRTREGEKVTVLVRIEPGAGSTETAGQALARSLRALRVPLGEPLWLSVVLLRGGRPGLNLETAQAAALARLDVVRLYYTAFGLEGSRAEYYLARPEPIAWALSALMSPLGSNHKRACEERIRSAALDADCRDFLLACVEDFQGRPAS